jgi:PAS domain S-box-containing protein
MSGVIQPDLGEKSGAVAGPVSPDEALKASEYRYRNLFQAMAASFWEIDFAPVGAMLRRLKEQGVRDFAQYFHDNPGFVREMMRASRIIDVNDQTVALYAGGDRELMSRLPLDAFWPEESTGVYAASVLAAISKQPNFSTETRLKKSNGEVFDALFTACFPPESVAKGTLLIGVIDISERKQAFAALERSETRYRNLFNSMGVTCYQLDIRALKAMYDALHRQGVTDVPAYIASTPAFVQEAMERTVVTDVNEPGIAFVGAKSRDEVLGPVSRFWIPEDCDVFIQSLISGYSGQPRFEAETRQRTLDGRVIDVLFTVAAAPAMREAGLVLVSLVDITARVRAQAALEKVQNDFAHAARISMLGELTASLAHEINQPLAAISANAAAGLRWLSRPEPDLAEVTAIARRMAADAQRAGEIISRIRLMASRQSPEASSVPVNSLIEEAMLFLRHEMQAQGVTVMLDLDKTLTSVPGDRTQLQQVVVNLAMNAIQAMAQSGAKQRIIRVSSQLADNRALRISVDDSGPGVPDSERGRLFDSFYTTKPDGMGMGLPICRSIIERHGGEIWVDSGTAGGARFCFTLPTD